MKAIVIHNTVTDTYARFEYSDSPYVKHSVIEKASIFWPEELEEGFEKEMLEMTSDAWEVPVEDLKLKEVKVSIK